MGLSASKRVNQTLTNSSDFNSACDSVYESSLALAQHAFPGIRPYQLFSSIERLHQSLSIPLITKWVPSPPTREQVDRAFKVVINRRSRPGLSQEEENEEDVIGNEEFKEVALEVFTDGIVSNARKEVLKRVPVGVAGIAGVGMLVRPGKEVVGTVMGVYALGVATAVYLSLAG
ncbi:uncharacterized protein LOC113765534 [Coffea eugenioides]|uniref:uncharacterized protein LOC113765534 n=1 Tax=Coffea eugenioides TaxID=49369 RepID=UPI000F60BCB2|nr:uncharacterized protein LOC113765534 [Coffea eugenioides]